MIYLLTAIGLSPDGSSIVNIYTRTVHRTYTNNNRTAQITTNFEQCGPCPVFASFTLAFALQLRKKHGKPSVRVRKTCQGKKTLSQSTVYIIPKHLHITKPIHTHSQTHTHTHTHTHITKPTHTHTGKGDASSSITNTSCATY
jgi:hypothetical protein